MSPWPLEWPRDLGGRVPIERRCAAGGGEQICDVVIDRWRSDDGEEQVWKVVPLPGGVDVRLSGRIDARELESANDAAYAAVSADVLSYHLFDLTEVTEFDVTSAGVREVAKADAAAVRKYPRLVTVIVAPRPLLFGVAREWQAQADDVEAIVVRSRLEAREWLAGRGFEPPPHE
jgi:hypothetical protein